MAQAKRQKHILANESGMIIADFIFALILTAAMSILLFSLSYSMAVIEVTQYISYSVARAYMAGSKSPDEQQANAEAKFTALTKNNKGFAPLYSGTWFSVGGVDKLDLRGGQTGNGKTFSEDLAGGADKRGLFLGASIPLKIGLLKFKLPFLGDTTPDHDEGLETRLNTMLIREPSEKECKDFMEQRKAALRALPSGKKFFEPASYIPMEDNGC